MVKIVSTDNDECYLNANQVLLTILMIFQQHFPGKILYSTLIQSTSAYINKNDIFPGKPLQIRHCD